MMFKVEPPNIGESRLDEGLRGGDAFGLSTNPAQKTEYPVLGSSEISNCCERCIPW